MIAKLEKEAGDEALEKAYCDQQMAKTEAKTSELEDDLAKMTSRIGKAAAKSAQQLFFLVFVTDVSRCG